LAAFNYPVEYTTLGSAPDRVFVVQWKNVNSPYYSSRLLNFQVRLYETTNSIEFLYGGVSGSGDIEYASFGIEDEIGGTGHFIDGPTGSNTVGTIDLNSYNNWPTLFYRFSPPPVIVVRPNGGEFFSIGYSDSIKWTSTVSDVRLEYSTDSGNNWIIIENTVPAALGKYNWLIPNTPSENSLVRISDASYDSVFDVSNNVFTIAHTPIITVSPDSFFYDLNVGDSIVTNLTIENHGLGELNFQISDRLIAGKISPKINQNYIHHRASSKEKPSFFGFDPANFPKIMNKEKVNPDLSVHTAKDNSMLLLPLLITDIIGDGGITDIKEIRGRIFNGNLEIEYVFADGINMSDSIIAELALDVDRNPMTGVTDPFNYHDLGVDYYVDYYPLYLGNEILIYEYSTGNSYTVPFAINGTTISYSIPLSFLGNDDGEMDLLAICAFDPFGVLDWAPDEGHVTLFNVFWLSEDPTSGVIPPGGNMTVEIRANTSDLIGGNYLASIDVQSNDPVNPVVGIPFALHLTGIPQIAVSPDSLNFGETYIGYHNSLSLSISSTGTDSLFGNIFSSDSRFVLLDSVFTIPAGVVKNIEVQFHPLVLATYNAQLTIYSNTASSPVTVSLTGEGVIAPNISTNTSLLEFQGNTGDTLQSNFIIYNTGGSDLTVTISDEVNNRAPSSESLFGVRENMIYEINPDNGQVINNFPTPVSANFASGLAFSGEYLFFTDADYTQNIFVLDPQNGNIITSYPSQSSYCDGLAYIDPYLYVSQNYSTTITVLNPLNGNLVKIINAQAPIWGGLDGGGDRLFASDNNTLYELNPKDGSIINSFFTVNAIYGIGFTLERLFTSVTWEGIDEYDPNTGNFIQTISTTGYAGLAGGGNRDADWLSENPVQVTIVAGDSISISLIIIAPNESGHYSADIILESNDPDSSITKLQVVLDLVTGVSEKNSLPTVYSLMQNYPNPFNPTTTINYDLPNQSNVNLKIYNIVGEEVATLINEEQNAGRYQIQWDASRLASGIYFYKLRAGSFVETKKMILIK
jgi:hypothetical protein